MTIDWTPIVQACLGAAALIMTGIVIPWAITAYQQRTGKQITDQQRSAVYSAAQTAGGIIETLLHQGKLSVADVTPDNPAIVKQAYAAVHRVSDAAAAQNTSVADMANLIVGRTNTAEAVMLTNINPPATPLPPSLIRAAQGNPDGHS